MKLTSVKRFCSQFCSHFLVVVLAAQAFLLKAVEAKEMACHWREDAKGPIRAGLFVVILFDPSRAQFFPILLAGVGHFLCLSFWLLHSIQMLPKGDFVSHI